MEALRRARSGLAPFWSAGMGQKALPEGWERLEFPSGGPARVGRPFWRDCRVGQGWEALLDSRVDLLEGRDEWEVLQESREGSGGPPRGLGGVRRLSRRAGGVGRPSQKARRGRESPKEGQKG